MSALWRIVLSAAPLLASMVLGWSWLTDAMAQGTHYVALGWYASLMGLFSIAMATWVPMQGAALSLLLAWLLRLRTPATVSATARRGMLLIAPILFLAMTHAVWTLMWWSNTPVATQFARYDTIYFFSSALILGSLAIAAGACAAWIVLRAAVPMPR
jgi:hypothetical protein